MALQSWRSRIRQGTHAFFPILRQSELDAGLKLLSPLQRQAFQRLSRYDKAHHLAVHRAVRDATSATLDLQHAALLHDIAKAGTDRQPGRVRLIHRVATVLLQHWWSTGLARLSRLPAPRWRAGLALAVHHASLGAELASALGSTDRTTWFIEHHHDAILPDDPELALLVRADRDAG
jgi:hypothetical protein